LNAVWRSLIAILGVCAVAWAIDVAPIDRSDAQYTDIAERILCGEKFNAVQLDAIRHQLSATPVRPVQASALSGATVMRLLLLEDGMKADTRQASNAALVDFQTVVSATLSQSPTNAFVWLENFWLKRRQAASADFDLLRMSYWSGPNEAWIALRRSPLALGIFQSLPSDLAEQTLSEFVGLVRSGLYADAANILAGPGWAIHEQLLSRVAEVDEANRRGFARALASKGLDGVTFPGVEDRPSRPF
jgi:hypothetical protein